MASWKQNKVVGIVAGLIAVVAIVFVVSRVVKPKGTEMTLIDTATNKVFKKVVPAGAEFPLVSEETGKKTVYQAQHFRCDKGHEFYLPMIVPGKEGSAGAGTAMQEYRCPIDGSTNLTLIK
jgi:hypothetical protein